MNLPSRFAEFLGVSRRTHARRWTPEVIARLGVDPDGRIARDMGLTNAAVRQKRLKLGIRRAVPPHRPARRQNGS